MTQAIERPPKRLFAVLLGIVLALGLVPGLGAGVAFAEDTYTLVVKKDTKGVENDGSYELGTNKMLELDALANTESVEIAKSGICNATASIDSTKKIATVTYSASNSGTSDFYIAFKMLVELK